MNGMIAMRVHHQMVVSGILMRPMRGVSCVAVPGSARRVSAVPLLVSGYHPGLPGASTRAFVVPEFRSEASRGRSGASAVRAGPRKAERWPALPYWVFMGINAGMSLNTDTLTITPAMLSLVAELDEFKGAWKALGTLAPERLSALRRVATIESIGSSTRIEGSKLSDAQVGQLLSNLEIKKFETRDEQEVAGYAEVMEMIFAHAEAISANRKTISSNYTAIYWPTASRMSVTEAIIKPPPIMSAPLMQRGKKLGSCLLRQHPSIPRA